MKNMIKDKDNLLVRNNLLSDVIGDFGVDKNLQKLLTMKKGLVEKLSMKKQWVSVKVAVLNS